jgi:magnesium and cobalt transporter
MGESSEGASGAARRAQPESDPDSSHWPALFTRLFGWEADETEDEASGPDRHRRDGEDGAGDLLVNLRALRSLRVDDVSVPRADIVSVPVEAGLDEVVEVFRGSENSRLPVYDETLDQPLGIVHLKDLALKYGFGAGNGAFDLRTLLRPLLYAPPSMRIGVLLQKMQASRIHMALVIDEYGGVDGLVTLEDLLEQIVGEIADEHDAVEGELWVRESDGVYLAQSRVELADFEEEIGVRLADPELAQEVETLGGLVFWLTGRVPARGEVVLHPDGHEFEVLDADARKIKRLRVRLKHPGEVAATLGRAAE